MFKLKARVNFYALLKKEGIASFVHVMFARINKLMVIERYIETKQFLCNKYICFKKGM